MKLGRFLTKLSLFGLLVGGGVFAAAAQTAFTYQGKLNDGGAPAGGAYDFTFRLFSAVSGGAQIGPDVTRDDVAVTNGIFTVNLDFGASPFSSGTGNYLEILVRPGASTGAYTTLAPRLPVASAPYAVKSLSADNAANAASATNSTTAQNALSLGGVAAAQFVQTTDARLSDARNPLPNSPNYIQNTTNQQASASFNISGSGTAGGTLGGNILNAATQFNLNGRRILTGSLVNIFAGDGSGAANPTGGDNSFFGRSSGASTTTGNANAFFGAQAGVSNVTGSSNAFFGTSAGLFTTAGPNSFFGTLAGNSTTTGINNSFFGFSAGGANTTGGGNTFIGNNTGALNTTGLNITLLGINANIGSLPIQNATAVGAYAAVTQSNSLVLGAISGINNCTVGNNCADVSVGIGTNAPNFKLEVIDPSNKGLRVQTNVTGGTVAAFGGNGAFQVDAAGVNGGRLSILENGFVGLGAPNPATRLDVAGIVTIRVLGTAGTTALCMNPSFQIGSCSSSRRYKENIRSFTPGLELVRRLRPVAFDWKANGSKDFGLVAEEVAAVEPLLATVNAEGEIEGVKYDRVGVVLVNAVNEQQTVIENQQRQIDEQNALIRRQQAELDRQKTELEALRELVCAQNPAAAVCRRPK
ncbi:MAG: tail fiber domain-containing protein [Acidobacteria bacterium]|nr:tail fiber domain-containing protein [Acidobacteriota bacterium]